MGREDSSHQCLEVEFRVKIAMKRRYADKNVKGSDVETVDITKICYSDVTIK